MSGSYVALAVAAWLPAAARSTAFAPPGAPRRFVETLASQLSGVDAAVSVAWAVAVAVVLFVAPRLRRDVAGTLVLGYAVPSLVSAGVDVYRVATVEGLILTPPGALGLVGLAGLVVLGSRWAAGRSRVPSAQPGG